MPFWLSIACLSAFQGALVALPTRPHHPLLKRLRSGGWAFVLPLSIAAFVLIAGAAEAASAQGLTYLALFAVPPLAALALAVLARGGRPPMALLAAALFGLAWVDRGGLAGNGAATVLSGLSCVALGALLGAVTPRRWLALGIVAMAIADTAFVVSDLLQSPNDALNAARPAANLPRLQSETFGSAVMGYGDVFVAAVLGGLLSADARHRQRNAAVLTIVLALAFDLLFFAVNELPATVPVALTLCVVELSRRRRSGAGERSRARSRAHGESHPRARPASRSHAP
jgi:hypothetical protein